MSKIDLVTAYHDYFRLIPADTEALKREVYRIRYDVYCMELGWESPEENPGGLERDRYDPVSHHCLLVHKPSNQFAGCVRLVRAVQDPQHPAIPLQEHCGPSLDRSLMDFDSLDRTRFGEISRLAIRAQFRRRTGERNSPNGAETGNLVIHPSQRRRFPHIALGLYLGAAAVGLAEGLDGVFAMMEPRLARHLRLTGIHFRQVGSVMEYHGPRAPFYIDRAGLFDNLRPELLELLHAIEEDLGLPSAVQRSAQG